MLLELLLLCGISLALAARGHRIAFGSCNEAERVGIWNVIEDAKPESLLLLGDNVYVDYKTIFGPKQPWAELVYGSKFEGGREQEFAYHYSLMKNDAKWKSLVQSLGGMQSGNVMATWDDHDYGIDDGDRSFENRHVSKKYFQDFMEIPLDSPQRLRSGVYNSQYFTINKQENNENTFTYKVIMLDGRFNKSPDSNRKVRKGLFNTQEPSSEESAETKTETVGLEEGDFLGEEQWLWLEQELLQHDRQVDMILIGSGIQVLPLDKVIEEYWFAFPKARRRLLNLVRYTQRNVVPNVFILSGDVHIAEILKSYWDCEGHSAKYKEVEREWIHEFTSSGMSHTFVKRTPEKDKSELPPRPSRPGDTPEDMGEEAASRNDHAGQLVELSRGSVYEHLYGMYVATGPNRAREQPYGHHYKGLHYGMLTLLSGSGSGEGEGEMVIEILNYRNEPMITVKVPLQEPYPFQNSIHRGLDVLPTTLQGWDEMYDHCDIVPVRGHTSQWRITLFKKVLTVYPVALVGLALLVLVLVLATLVSLLREVYGFFVASPQRASKKMKNKTL